MNDLRTLETFYWVAVLGGFSAAADKLHTTQPAVSTRVAQLEQTLGVKLFIRSHRKVTLTERGVLLQGYAEKIFQIRTEMMQMVSNASDAISGNFRLGVSETLVHTWLSDLLDRISDQYPNVTIDIAVDNTPEIHKQLLSHDLDLGLVAAPLNHPDARSLKLCAYPFAIIASPQLGVPDAISDASLFSTYPIITYSREALSSKTLLSMAQEKFSLNSLRLWGIGPITAIVDMVKNCRGIGAVSPVNIQNELANGTLQILKTGIKLDDLRFYSTYLTGTSSFLKETIKELAHKAAWDYDIQHLAAVDLIQRQQQ